MKKNITILILALCLIPQFSSAQSRKINKLKKAYIQCSLQSFDGTTLSTLKWENTTTLKYHITGKFNYISKREWNKFLQKIEKLTNIKFVATDVFSEANIFIYFGELADYFKRFNIDSSLHLTSKFDNWNNRRYNRKRELTRASFCIVPSKTKSRERGRFNIKQLFIRSLGLMGKSDNESSIFYKYQTDSNYRLSRTDKRIIKIHYNPTIKPAMNKQELEKVLDAAIDLNKLIKEKL